VLDTLDQINNDNSPREHEVISDDEIRANKDKVHLKKSKTRKNHRNLSPDEISESDDCSSEHDTNDIKPSDLDPHQKKHHFHFPTILTIPWQHIHHHHHHHKRTGPTHKKEKDSEHSTTNIIDHETDDRILGPLTRKHNNPDSQRRPISVRKAGPIADPEILEFPLNIHKS